MIKNLVFAVASAIVLLACSQPPSSGSSGAVGRTGSSGSSNTVAGSGGSQAGSSATATRAASTSGMGATSTTGSSAASTGTTGSTVLQPMCTPCSHDSDCGPAGQAYCVFEGSGSGYCGPVCQSNSDCNANATCFPAGTYQVCYPSTQTCVGYVPTGATSTGANSTSAATTTASTAGSSSTGGNITIGTIGGTRSSGTSTGGGTTSAGTSTGGQTSTGTAGAGTTGTPPGNINILVYPNGNHAAELIAAINGAKTSVYMTMYEIDDSGVIGAITSAKQRGLDVKVILDSSTTTRSNNQGAYSSFSGYVVWSSSSFTYTHEKCVMIDHTTAWIMTANAESSVPEYNREYLAIDTSQADVAEAEAIFKADYALQPITPTGDLVVANTNARPDLVSLINSAKKSLDIEDEEFSDNDSNGITDAVVAAANRGVTVRLVVAGGSSDSTQTTALNDVKSAPGASVFVSSVASGGGSASNPYIHAKAILVDCATGTCTSGFVGSENMTTGSLLYNRELGVILSDSSQLAKVLTAMNTDFSNATKQ